MPASSPGRLVVGLLSAAWIVAAAAGMLTAGPGSGGMVDMLAYSFIIPILCSTFAFGRAGGLFAALAASLACGSVVVSRPGELSSPEVLQLLYQVAVFNVVALVTSWLMGRMDAARRRYRDLFDDSPVGMYRLDAEGRILEINKAAARMMRAPSRRALLGVNARDLFVEPRDLRGWLESVKSGGAEEFEARLRRMDGTVIWVRDRNQAVYDAEGAVRYFEGMVEDVTQRRHGETISAILYDITEAVARTRDLSHLYATIHDILRRHVDAENFAISLVDRDRLAYVYFEDERGPGPPDSLDLDKPAIFSLSLHVIRTGQPLLLDREAMAAMARDSGLITAGPPPQAWLGVPLMVRGEVVGCMAVRHYGDPSHYTDKDVALMTAVSDHVALAIERKMDADALAVSEAKYRAIFENAAEGIFQCAPDGRFIGANPAMAGILGFHSPEALLDSGKGLGEFLAGPPDGSSDVMALLRGDSRVRGLETGMTTADGRTIWVCMNARRAESDALGEFVEGWVEDVTQRRQAERELERARALYHDIIDFLPDATMVMDADRRIIAWNKAMEEMTKVGKERMLGRKSTACGEVFYGRPRQVLMDLLWEDDQALRERYDFVRREDDSLVAEVHIPGLDGGNGGWVWAVAAPLYDAEGRMTGAIESVRDVTVRKRAEQELRRARDEMERRVEERTRELRLANRRLRELDEMKSEFLSSASHELRTPLTSVLGFVKLISKSFGRHFEPLARGDAALERQAGRIRDNLEIIGFEGQRLTRLINDLLDLNKIESGRMDWRDEPLDVGDLVRRAVQSVQGEFESLPEVELAVEVAEDMPMVLADRDRMHQVVMNLLSNAAKFTAEGTVRVSAEGDGDRVRVVVRDTGPGIPPGDRERIFGKFYQSSAVQGREKFKGTGLGLTICREIAEHYGGSISVDSEPGRGSAFTLELPARAG